MGLILIWSKLHFPAGGRACVSSSSALPSNCGGFLPPDHFLAFCWLQKSFPSLKSQAPACSRHQEGKNLKYESFCWKTLLKLRKPQLHPCREWGCVVVSLVNIAATSLPRPIPSRHHGRKSGRRGRKGHTEHPKMSQSGRLGPRLHGFCQISPVLLTTPMSPPARWSPVRRGRLVTAGISSALEEPQGL